LIGTVTSADGEPLPGVTVTVASPTMLGERSVISAVNGDYIFKGLPPGAYTVRFTLEGMQTVERGATIPLGGTARSDAAMEVMAASETVVVEGEAPSALETTTVGANFNARQVDALPINRTPNAIVELAGGVTDNTPNVGQVAISGGFAYDNVFMVNGVDITENLFGDFDNLFIEDAIAETQVLTSGVSAEYGRFSGGVINSITKSGGNQFSGSLRADLTRAEWRDETPYEKDRGLEREGDLNKIYQATFGGPVMRDRLWFFLAAQQEETDNALVLAVTGIPFNTVQQNERWQAQLSGAITSSHSVQISYTDNTTDQLRVRSSSRVIDELGLIDRNFPNVGWSAAYNGVLTNSLFGEVRYSEKEFGFRNAGGSSTLITDSPFRSQGALPGTSSNRNYNAPYFDATDPEDRNNEQSYAALSWFLTSESLGSHDLKVGAERFVGIGRGGNSQTATDYVLYTDYLIQNGRPAVDANGRIIPVFTPGLSGMGNWQAARGVQFDITTDSFFLNDRWAIDANWSVNLGVRYEATNTETTGNLTTIDSDAIVPRLGVSYDIKGDGKYKVDVTYAEYAGRYNQAQVAANTSVGTPSLLYGYYVGPAGQGIDFAPGFDPSNYVFYYAAVPTANVFVDDNLKTPLTREVSLSGGIELPKGGFLKATYIDRDVSNFIEDYIDTTTGVTEVILDGVSAGLFENQVIRNTNDHERKYQALLLQGSYRLTDSWSVAGNWTYQIANEGDFEGELANQPGLTSGAGNFPELFVERNNPSGRFDDFQEHKVRLWSNYTFDLGRAGGVDLGVVYRYDSPIAFSYVANSVPYSAIQRSRDPGYNSIGRTQTNLFFGDRGAGEFEESHVFDMAVQYRVPIWRSVEPWVKFELRNMFNEDALQTFDTTVTPNNNGPLDADGLPTEFIRSPTFGQATSEASHVVPREYLISAGIRF
jgi:outer membrane receptor for ferrienterochelin and colicin